MTLAGPPTAAMPLTSAVTPPARKAGIGPAGPLYVHPLRLMVVTNSTIAAMMFLTISGSSETSVKVPTGTNSTAATDMGAMVRQSHWRAPRGTTCTDATAPRLTVIATASTGPQKRVNSGAITSPEPKPV